MLRPLVATLTTLMIVGAGLVAATPARAALPKPSPGAATVLINELAGGGRHSDADGFFELRNWGDEAVDLTGWEIYRCNHKSLRNNIGRAEADLTGRVLQPGEILTISRIGLDGDLHMTAAFDLGGYGLFLEAPDDSAVDMVGVYPNQPWPTQGECTPPGGNLPNVLDFAQDESWQRIAATGDPATDWIVAAATLGTANAARPPAPADSAVVISEFAGAGPAGPADDFVELRNTGAEAVDLGGWELFRCSASGRLRPDTRQLTIAAGTSLAPGQTWVAAADGFTGPADARYPRQLADREFGVLVRDGDGALVDRVAVTAYRDSACQGDTKLPSELDMARAESYQRTAAGTYLIAPRTPGRPNAVRADALVEGPFGYDATPGVAISELATDPHPEGMPTGSVQRNYVEIGNYGDTPVDVGGWTLWRCMVDGARAVAPQVTIPRGTVLAPGEVFLAARAGTAEAERADAAYDESFSFRGTGVWLTDADGGRVDSLGVYAVNELDAINTTPSPCTKSAALATYLPDRLLRETFQRTAFTAVDADDFVAAEATPGVLDLIPYVDPTRRVDIRPDVVSAPVEAAPETPAGDPVVVVEAWGGVSQGGPLTTASGDDEIALDPTAPGVLADDGYGYPYQRLVLDAGALPAGSTVSWVGGGLGRTEVQLSVWTGRDWRLLDAATGDHLVLEGALEAADIRDGEVVLLVQNGPRTQGTLAPEADGQLQDPSDYDFAVSHITDTQYLSESYPEVYATLASWIAANAEGRKIEFATHTGDLVQNHVDPAQDELRAVREFERASAIQSILDDAGVANSVLPGNHDNVRGGSAALFNAYFGPDRYADSPAYGGSLTADDNSANYSTFAYEGAKFLMLSLPYAFGDVEMTWAEEVVARHPDHNVIISTHEHVTPKTTEAPAFRSTSSRWVSRGQQLWDRVIAPNRNVVLVLSGHFHGLGRIRTEDAGGLPGHTVTELVADYQEFRTHTGERATGFQRLLQFDLAAGAVAVDTFSLRLDESSAAEYDYRQSVPDNGSALTPSNGQPWRVVESGLQHRYGVDDDEFVATAQFQYPKSVETVGVVARVPGPAAAPPSGLRGLFAVL